LPGFVERGFEGGALIFEGIDAFRLTASGSGFAVETIEETHAGLDGRGEKRA
jgi:hypothetical protein